MGIEIAIFLSLIIVASCRTISFAYQSGTLIFDQSSLAAETETRHIDCPAVLYSLTRMHAESYFSLLVRYEREQGHPSDRTRFTVGVGGVGSFSLSLQYVLLESMPHLEVAHVNLTWARPSKVHHSRKGLAFDERTLLSSHLVGFSSSEYAHDRFFYADKGAASYHFYTTANLSIGHWVAMQVLILVPVYSRNNVLCFGNRIDMQTEISDDRALGEVSIPDGFNFIIGLEAIYQPKVQFKYEQQARTISFSGTYSYSIISINNSCTVMENVQPQLTDRAKVYFVIMIAFMALTGVLFTVMFVYCVQKQRSQSQDLGLDFEFKKSFGFQNEEKMVQKINLQLVVLDQIGQIILQGQFQSQSLEQNFTKP